MKKIITQINPKYKHLPTWLAALAIILCSTVGNLYWLHHNVVLVGRDSGGHLERTLKVANILSDFSVQSIFQALQSYPTLSLGEVLHIEAAFAGRVGGSLKISFRLIDPNGTLLAQRDDLLMEKVKTNLFLPPRTLDGNSTQLGEYTLRAVIYDPQTLTPLPGSDGNREIHLAVIAVESD